MRTERHIVYLPEIEESMAAGREPIALCGIEAPREERPEDEVAALPVCSTCAVVFEAHTGTPPPEPENGLGIVFNPMSGTQSVPTFD